MESIRIDSPSEKECRQINELVQRSIGAKLFGSIFHYKLDSCASLVNQWKNNGTGPIFWTRELLLKISAECPHDGGRIVQRILNFLARPFNKYVLDYMGHPGNVKCYVRGFRTVTTELAEYFESIENSTSPDSPNGTAIDPDEFEDIENKCDELISAALSLKEHVRREMLKNMD